MAGQMRQPKGIPVGGQFAASERADSGDLAEATDEVTEAEVQDLLTRSFREGRARPAGRVEVVEALEWSDGDRDLAVSYMVRRSRMQIADLRAQELAGQADEALTKSNQMALVSAATDLLLLSKGKADKLEVTFADDSATSYWRTFQGGHVSSDALGHTVASASRIDPRRADDLLEFASPGLVRRRPDGSIVSMFIDIDKVTQAQIV